MTTVFLFAFQITYLAESAQSLCSYADISGTSTGTHLNGGAIWVGITFDNNSGATGATAAQLNNLGMPTYNSPFPGSSQDRYFVTSGVGDFVNNNPTGSITNLGGTPVANFGWRLFVVTPEPGTCALIAVSAPLPLAAILLRCRRKSARRACPPRAVSWWRSPSCCWGLYVGSAGVGRTGGARGARSTTAILAGLSSLRVSLWTRQAGTLNRLHRS